MTPHATAIAAFERGEIAEALKLLSELLKSQESSELWNDWATIQAAANDLAEAESGFLRALELDANNHQARANLGLLLLGRGEYERSIPLLEEASAAFPEAEQDALRAALTAARERVRSNQSESEGLSILIIHDAIAADRSPLKCRTLQLVKALSTCGHAVTFIVRDDRNAEHWQPALQKLGVRFVAGDAARMQALGREIAPSDWHLEQVLTESGFAVAFLTQNFNHGISIPEHYLNEIRRHSPATRIAVLCDEVASESAAQRFAADHEFRHHEIAEDYRSREQEIFVRADLVVVPTIATAKLLRGKQPKAERETIVLAGETSRISAELARVINRAISLAPKPLAAAPFSINLVDSIYASLLQTAVGEKRVYARLDFYIQLAEQLLRQDKPAFAREQLRHVFGWLGDSIKSAPALAQPIGLLKRCYRNLQDDAMAERCGEEARRCFLMGTRDFVPTAVHSGEFRFSLIVPTYNRLPILRKCMAALQKQTIPLEQFEVIVIDDGSSDGTEEFMRSYRPPFHLQYLRQENSGTGAARQNGVQHATGEYLLLMNDDTICDPVVIAEHLRAQEIYSGYRCAVLGDFEYPEQARQRALTHFFRVNSFMFPQVDMTEGCPYGYSHFITCNLSIRREAVAEAGSFDSTYRLSEDTEMGIRLFENGYGVIYHPAAHAWHDHLPYPASSLIRRARVYGADYFYMFRNHPRVMQEWAMPFRLQGMDERDANGIHDYLERNRADVEAAFAALARWDSVDFEPILSNPEKASHVLSWFQQAVPAIHWFHLFESMLETMVQELHLPQPARALGAAAGV